MAKQMTIGAEQAEACVFCGIIGGEVEAAIVFEDEKVVAFLDNRPIFPGHVLLVPREHYATISDVPDSTFGKLFLDARLVAKAQELALRSEGTFIAVNDKVSQSVPHVHVHIVPRRPHDGLKGFFWPRGKYKSDDEMKSVQNSLIKALKELGKG